MGLESTELWAGLVFWPLLFDGLGNGEVGVRVDVPGPAGVDGAGPDGAEPPVAVPPVELPAEPPVACARQRPGVSPSPTDTQRTNACIPEVFISPNLRPWPD